MGRRATFTTVEVRRDLYERLAAQAAAEGTTVPRLVDRRLMGRETEAERMARLEEEVAAIKAALGGTSRRRAGAVA